MDIETKWWNEVTLKQKGENILENSQGNKLIYNWPTLRFVTSNHIIWTRIVKIIDLETQRRG